MNNDPLLLSIIDLLLKSTAILTVAFTVQHFWGKASAATLNMVWVMAFGALLLLPLTRLAEPLWATSLVEKKTVQVQVMPMALPVVEMEPASVEMNAAPAPAALPLPDTKQVLLGAWLLAAGLLMLRTLLGGLQLRRIKKQSLSLQQAPAGELTRRLAQAWGVSRPIGLYESKEVSVPLTWGTLRPVLMLPQGAERWKREQLLAALQHELGHIKRYDVLTRGLMDFACALYWINPLVWFAAKAMRLTQERACDDLVLNAGISAEGYATQLLESARAAQGRFNHRLPALAMAQPSTLETRLLAIVDEQQNRRPIGRLTRLLAGSAAIMVLLLSATMQLRAEGQTPADDSSKSLQQVHINVKVIEAPSGTLKTVLKGLDPGKMMSQDQAATIIQRIANTPKTDLLSAPSVTTRNGQQATVQVGREYFWPGNEKEMTFIGISASFLPAVTEKGEIKLKADVVNRKLVSEEPKPLFRESKTDTELLLQSDQSVILSGSASGEDDREQLFVISAKLLDATGNATTSAVLKAKSGVQVLADKIIIPSMVFQEASLEEAVDFLRNQSKVYDAEKKGINFVIQAPSEAMNAKLTLSLKDIPLSEALNYIAQLTDTRVVYENNACVFKSPETSAAAAIKTSTVSAVAETGVGHGLSSRAEKIIIPHLEFAQATVSEAIEFLRVMSHQHDPEKKGVNLILKRFKAWDEPGGSEPVISLLLKDIPLTEALKYVAELSNLKLTAQDNAYVLSAGEAPASAANKKDRPVKLESETVSTNEATGITEASGNVILTAGDLTVKTDHLTYDTRQQKAVANGRVEITRGSSVTTALGQVELNLKNGELKVNGTSTVRVR